MSDASNTAQLPGSILRELSDIVDKRKASVELNPKDVDWFLEMNFLAVKVNDVFVLVDDILSSRDERGLGFLCSESLRSIVMVRVH